MKQGCRKLTENDYEAILFDLQYSGLTQQKIARKFGLNVKSIMRMNVCRKAIDNGDSVSLMKANEKQLIPDRMYVWALMKMGKVKPVEKEEKDIPPVSELGPKEPSMNCIKTEKDLRGAVQMGLDRRIHISPKKSIEWLVNLLHDASESGMAYDISDMESAMRMLAAQAGSDADYCHDCIDSMIFKTSEPKTYNWPTNEEIANLREVREEKEDRSAKVKQMKELHDSGKIIKQIAEDMAIAKDSSVRYPSERASFYITAKSFFKDRLHETIDENLYDETMMLLSVLEDLRAFYGKEKEA